MKKERLSNLELLRIFSMIMIIGLHFLGGYIAADVQENYYKVNFLESMCIVGVNIFVIIYSYFMVEKKETKLRKIIDLLILTSFYGILFFAIAVLFKIQPFTIKELILSIIPFLEGRRWFVIAFVFLSLITPYLVKLISGLSKKEYQVLLIISLFFLSIWPTILPGGLRLDDGYGIISFVQLFLLTGYIKKYFNDKKHNKYIYLGVYIISVIMLFILSIAKINGYWNYNNIFNIIGAISIFLFFKNINMKSNKYINKIANHNFSVFLIHSDFMLSTFFYNNIMHRYLYINNDVKIFYFLICVFGSYVVCIIIDIIRAFIFKYTIDKILNRIKPINKTLIVK